MAELKAGGFAEHMAEQVKRQPELRLATVRGGCEREPEG